jgi:H+-translocating diphosphatase
LAPQAALAASLLCLPSSFHIKVPSATPGQEFDSKVVQNWYLFFCVAVGLWGGLIIGLQTEYFTSNAYKPVQVHTHALPPSCTDVQTTAARGMYPCINWSLQILLRSHSVEICHPS